MSPTSTLPRTVLASTVAVALLFGVPGCSDRGTDRWVTTENSAVEIDWDEVAKAYREAEGPEDFETRVNEIYEGDEVISVAVHDQDERTQVVTGFFDQNEDGSVQDGEKVFTMRRDVTGADQAQYQIAGHGPYAGYHSPVWDIAAGMFMGSMLSRVFMPSYMPMYTQPYVTSPSRRGGLVSHRNSYRAANPDKFQRSSKSGRSYGRTGGGFGGGRAAPPRAPRGSGGGRFGIRRTRARAMIRVVE